VQEAQREARLASCLATPGMTGQERSTGELFNSAVRRLAVASDVNTQLRCAEPPSILACTDLPVYLPLGRQAKSLRHAQSAKDLIVSVGRARTS